MLAVGRLDAVAERFEGIAQKVSAHELRIGSLEQSRGTSRKFVGWAAGIVASTIVGLLLFFLIGRAK